jgi:error-prone DNA polymerase
MENIRDQFLEGARRNGVEDDVAKQVFEKLEGFAQYGFPKSHAAAFGLLAYQSCWLKHYHPTEFLCALLNNQPMGFYAPHVLINDAKRSGVHVWRPDINKSDIQCTVERTRTVRIGLSFVKGVQQEVAERIIDERSRNGAFRSLADLMRRVVLRPDALRNLIAAGACDGFGLQRREMLWQIGLFIAPRGFTSGPSRRIAGKQLPLAVPTEQDHVTLPPTTAWERMADEYRTLGLSTQFHPMHLLRSRLPADVTSTRELGDLPDGYRIRIPGLIVCRQRPGTAKGITFLLLEDEAGLVNVVVYPKLYERQRLEVRSTPLLIVEGTLQRSHNNINVVAHRVQPIENVTFARPEMREGWDIPPTQHADPERIQLVRLTAASPDDGPRTPADIRALAPASHNYR